MNCRNVSERLSAYLDRELSGQEMLEIRDHLRTCSACDQQLRELSKVRGLMRNWASQDGAHPPVGLRTKIRDRVYAEAQPTPAPRLRWQWAATAAVAICAFGLVWDLRGDQAQDWIVEESGVQEDALFDTEIFLQPPDSVTGMSPMMPAAYQH